MKYVLHLCVSIFPPGLDFLDINPEFTFPVGSTVGDTACVTVSIVDDTLIESTEQFTASLDNAEAVSVNNDENAVLVKIEDNDGANLPNIATVANFPSVAL